MTNQLTPQHGISPMELLEIARVVEPDKDWRVKGDVVYNYDTSPQIKTEAGWVLLPDAYNPHKPTERGQAQLMGVVFAVSSAIRDRDPFNEVSEGEWDTFNYILATKNINIILSLAHEVLVQDQR